MYSTESIRTTIISSSMSNIIDAIVMVLIQLCRLVGMDPANVIVCVVF